MPGRSMLTSCLKSSSQLAFLAYAMMFAAIARAAGRLETPASVIRRRQAFV